MKKILEDSGLILLGLGIIFRIIYLKIIRNFKQFISFIYEKISASPIGFVIRALCVLAVIFAWFFSMLYLLIFNKKQYYIEMYYWERH
jgi:hypothetical protein